MSRKSMIRRVMNGGEMSPGERRAMSVLQKHRMNMAVSNPPKSPLQLNSSPETTPLKASKLNVQAVELEKDNSTRQAAQSFTTKLE